MDGSGWVSGPRAAIVAVGLVLLVASTACDGAPASPAQTNTIVMDAVAALKAGDATTRRQAVRDLAGLGPSAAAAAGQLASALSDPDVIVRMHAAIALGGTRKKARRSLEALTDALRDDDKRVARAAELALRMLQPDTRQLIPLLEKRAAELRARSTAKAQDPQALAGLADIHLDIARLHAELQRWEDVAKHEGAAARLHLKCALVFIRADKASLAREATASALAVLERAEEQSNAAKPQLLPDLVERLAGIGANWREQGKPGEALHYEELAASEQTRAALMIYLQRDYEGARDAAKESLRLLGDLARASGVDIVAHRKAEAHAILAAALAMLKDEEGYERHTVLALEFRDRSLRAGKKLSYLDGLVDVTHAGFAAYLEGKKQWERAKRHHADALPIQLERASSGGPQTKSAHASRLTNTAQQFLAKRGEREPDTTLATRYFDAAITLSVAARKGTGTELKSTLTRLAANHFGATTALMKSGLYAAAQRQAEAYLAVVEAQQMGAPATSKSTETLEQATKLVIETLVKQNKTNDAATYRIKLDALSLQRADVLAKHPAVVAGSVKETRAAADAFHAVAKRAASSKQWSQADEASRRAIELMTGLHRRDMKNQDHRVHLAQLFRERADTHATRRAWKESLADHAEGLRLRLSLARDDSSQAWYWQLVSYSLERIGTVNQLKGDLAPALKAQKAALAYRETLIKATPSDGLYYACMWSRVRVAELHIALKQGAQGLPLLEAAVEGLEARTFKDKAARARATTLLKKTRARRHKQELLLGQRQPSTPNEHLEVGNVRLAEKAYAAATEHFAKALDDKAMREGGGSHFLLISAAAAAAAASATAKPPQQAKLTAQALTWIREALTQYKARSEKALSTLKSSTQQLFLKRKFESIVEGIREKDERFEALRSSKAFDEIIAKFGTLEVK